ncbi:MAG TPA: hypothetical protein VH107_18445 [Lacipirellulaceae bacterium]|jgi:hypothetical protein|nr:hypothetical protein [Lacipirellulaceae bacterium]
MADTARASSVWSLDGTTSSLNCGKFSGEINIARPHVGLHQPEFDYKDSPCTFLGVLRSPEEVAAPNATVEESDRSWWPLAVDDFYIRGNDLVATYHPADAWPYAPQIYWQAQPASASMVAFASMSLLVSVQTQLLDTHPKIIVASAVPSSELYYVSLGGGQAPRIELIKSDPTYGPSGGSCCIVRRLLTAPLSYVEFMPSTDFQQLKCSSGPRGKAFVQWHLFSEFLEKGVIQRARVHGALLPSENDIQMAIECCSAFMNSPLPLTA